MSLIVSQWACTGGSEAPKPPQSPSAATPSPQAQSITAVAPPALQIPAVHQRHYTFKTTTFGRIPVQVVVPPGKGPFPVLVALHGMGEALKPREQGARGWMDDYGLGTAMERLQHPPLTVQDFGKMITQRRLKRHNQALQQKPYRGVIVVCPYTPNAFSPHRISRTAALYGKWIIEELLPQIYRDTPAIGTPETTGIDGVSLGGRVSLMAGTAYPSHFGVVAAIQPAFSKNKITYLAERIQQATNKNGALEIRLLTSRDDVYRDFTQQLSNALNQKKIAHQFNMVLGNHSYGFNRGPGVYEMLIYHNTVLRPGAHKRRSR